MVVVHASALQQHSKQIDSVFERLRDVEVACLTVGLLGDGTPENPLCKGKQFWEMQHRIHDLEEGKAEWTRDLKHRVEESEKGKVDWNWLMRYNNRLRASERLEKLEKGERLMCLEGETKKMKMLIIAMIVLFFAWGASFEKP